MPPEPVDSILNAFVGAASLLSISTLAYLVAAWRRGPWLPYEPRRPVPWNVAALIPALVLVVMALASPGTEPRETPAGAEYLAAGILFQLFVAGGLLFLVAVLSRATPRDFGVPANAEQTARDITIGVVACLASLAPVHLTQVVIMHAVGRGEEESAHPYVKMIMEHDPNMVLFFLIAVAAVIVAPLCEEFIFRVLLQGWLEKWEDRHVSPPASPPLSPGEPAVSLVERAQGEGTPLAENTNSPLAEQDFDGIATPPPPPEPSFDQPAHGIGGLPHGWVPVITSALFFGLAHFGYGPEPVPLFFLGLILGYIYHRTHRVLPCIVAHATFNFFTVFVLWRTVFFGQDLAVLQ